MIRRIRKLWRGIPDHALEATAALGMFVVVARDHEYRHFVKTGQIR